MESAVAKFSRPRRGETKTRRGSQGDSTAEGVPEAIAGITLPLRWRMDTSAWWDELHDGASMDMQPLQKSDGTPLPEIGTLSLYKTVS